MNLNENHQQIPVEKSSEDLELTENNEDFFGPALPPNFSKGKTEKVYGPSLPNHFKEDTEDKSNEHSPTALNRSSDILIGPEIPKHFASQSTSQDTEENSAPEDVNFGPSTTLMASENAIDNFLYTKNFHKKIENDDKSNIKRESWMTELPEKKKATFGLFQRHFKTHIQTEKESDSSVWTETPASKKQKETKINKEDYNEILKQKRLEERNREMEKLAKKAAKKLKKKESLLEIHLKKMKKKKKKESKKEKKEGTVLPKRRPFDREVDLRICKYDGSQKRASLMKTVELSCNVAKQSKCGNMYCLCRKKVNLDILILMIKKAGASNY